MCGTYFNVYVEVIISSGSAVPYQLFDKRKQHQVLFSPHIKGCVPEVIRYGSFGVPTKHLDLSTYELFLKTFYDYTLGMMSCETLLSVRPVSFAQVPLKLPPRLREYSSAQLQHQFNLFVSMFIGYNSLRCFAPFFRLLLQSTPIRQHNQINHFTTEYIGKLLNYRLQYGRHDMSKIFFLISISGKVGVVGNSRKRTHTYKFGIKKKNPTRNKPVLAFYRHRFFLVSTATGVLGVRVLYYTYK
jgi:hypothetical protein